MKHEGWYRRVILDMVNWIVAALLCMLWRWVADKSEIATYWALFGVLMILWIVIGFIVQMYRSYKVTWFWQAILSLLADGGILIGLCWWLLPKLPYNLSPRVAMWTILIVMVLEAILILMEHYWKYATNMTIPVMQIEQRENAVCTRPDSPRSQAMMRAVRQSVLSVTTEEDFRMLLDKARLDNRRTKTICDRSQFAIMQIPDYQYKTIVDLTLLNDARGINRRFCVVNQKLPDEGRYVCCYRPQEYMKQKFLNRYPPILRWFAYTLYFFRKKGITASDAHQPALLRR